MSGWAGAGVVLAWVALAGVPAEGARWTRAYINALHDEAFASVEVRPDGTRARHLPHHHAEGWVDLAHLRSAMGRLHQVKWVDPANAERARQHLIARLRELGLPAPGEPRVPAASPGGRRGVHPGAPRGGDALPGARVIGIPKAPSAKVVHPARPR